MLLEYHMLRGNVGAPYRANPSDAGLDIRYIPPSGLPAGNDHIIEPGECAINPMWSADNDHIIIEPGECAIIPTGLKFGIPHGYMLEVKNRSSVAAKRSLLVGACVIDSGYNGEVFVNLHNVGKDVQYIKSGERIAQVVLIPVVHFRAVATSEDNLYKWYPITISNRGDGALGSTDDAFNS